MVRHIRSIGAGAVLVVRDDLVVLMLVAPLFLPRVLPCIYLRRIIAKEQELTVCHVFGKAFIFVVMD